MKLTVSERLNLSIPQKGSIEGQLLVKSITEKITLTKEEIKKIGGKDLKTDITCPHCGQLIREVLPGGFSWQDDNYEKDIEFTKEELIVLKKEVDKVSQEEQINQKNLSVCLKISNLFPKEKENERK